MSDETEGMDFHIEGASVDDDAAKAAVADALRQTLSEQLATEVETRGQTPGRAAIHGMTGVSNKMQ